MEKIFANAAGAVARATGRPAAFIACVTLVVVWALCGPVFGFSDTWQLVINTGTTIITFLMVFLIQNTQNRDGAAIQAKLDELIRVSRGKNDFIGIEHLSEAEVEEFRIRCENAAKASSGRSPAATAEDNQKKIAAHEKQGKRRAAEIRKGGAKSTRKANVRSAKVNGKAARTRAHA